MVYFEPNSGLNLEHRELYLKNCRSLIRLAAFHWLAEQIKIHGDVLPRTLLEQGFNFQGQRVTLIGPAGIWKPQQMALPISITIKFNSPYNDSEARDGLLEYKYRGDHPSHRDNMGLREVMW